MEDDAPPPKAGHQLGSDLSRLSVGDLRELKAALFAEVERIDREIAAKGATRQAADSLFRL